MNEIIKNNTFLSELDELAIKNNVAMLNISSIFISKTYTENIKRDLQLMNSMNRKEWNVYCNNMRDIVSDKMEQILTILGDSLKIFQYNNKEDLKNYRCNNKDDYRKQDLFFECDQNNNKNRKLSDLTVSFNKEKTEDERQAVLQTVFSLMNGIDLDGITVYIRYIVEYNNEKVEQIKKDFMANITDDIVDFYGVEGNLKLLNDNGNPFIAFFKKGECKTYCGVGDTYILTQSLINA